MNIEDLKEVVKSKYEELETMVKLLVEVVEISFSVMSREQVNEIERVNLGLINGNDLLKRCMNEAKSMEAIRSEHYRDAVLRNDAANKTAVPVTVTPVPAAAGAATAAVTAPAAVAPPTPIVAGASTAAAAARDKKT